VWIPRLIVVDRSFLRLVIKHSKEESLAGRKSVGTAWEHRQYEP